MLVAYVVCHWNHLEWDSDVVVVVVARADAGTHVPSRGSLAAGSCMEIVLSSCQRARQLSQRRRRRKTECPVYTTARVLKEADPAPHRPGANRKNSLADKMNAADREA